MEKGNRPMRMEADMKVILKTTLSKGRENISMKAISGMGAGKMATWMALVIR